MKKRQLPKKFQKHLVALHHLDCPWRPRDIKQREGRILRSGNLNKKVRIYFYATQDSGDLMLLDKVQHKQTMTDAFLRADPNVYSIEDMSETVLSLQDLQSMTTSNPLIKERTSLATTIAKLEMSRKVHSQQQQSFIERIEKLKREMPQTEYQIKNLKKDAAERIDISGDKFQMKLGNEIYTERSKAAAALEELQKNFKLESLTKVGEIGGFDIMMRSEDSYGSVNGVVTQVHHSVLTWLQNNGSYHVENSIQSMQRLITKGIDKRLEQAEAELSKDKATLAELETNIKPFEKLKELSKAKMRLAEIDAQLKKETVEAPTRKNKHMKITLEVAKNGGKIYYADGQRVSESDAKKFERQQAEEEIREQFDNFSDGNEIKTADTPKVGAYFVEVIYKTESGLFDADITNLPRSAYFDRAEDAVACAKYLKAHSAKLKSKIIGISVYDLAENNERGDVYFEIDESGNEKTDAVDKSENPYAAIQEQLHEFEFETDKSGRSVYKIDGKRVNRTEFESRRQEQGELKGNILFSEFEKQFKVSPSDIPNKGSFIKIFTGEGWANRTYPTFEDAVKCARFVKENYSDVAEVSITNDGSRFIDFWIDKNGENFRTEEAKQAVAAIEAETKSDGKDDAENFSSKEAEQKAAAKDKQAENEKLHEFRMSGTLKGEEHYYVDGQEASRTAAENLAKEQAEIQGEKIFDEIEEQTGIKSDFANGKYLVRIRFNKWLDAESEPRIFNELEEGVKIARAIHQRHKDVVVNVDLAKDGNLHYIYEIKSDGKEVFFEESAKQASAEAYAQMTKLLGKKNVQPEQDFSEGGVIDEGKKSERGNEQFEVEKIIDAEDLNSRQRALAEFGKRLGVNVIFFKGDKKLHGAYSKGVTYINADSETSHEWAFWHESFHWLAANNPALLKEIADAVKVSAEQIEKYRRETGRHNLTDAEAVEEILADNMKDTATRAGLFRQIGKKNKSLIERLISWLKSVIDKFTDFFNTPKNGLTREQKNKMYDAFGKMVRTITDGDGNAVFRFNSRTKAIELANGAALPQVKFSMRDTTIADSTTEPQKIEIAKGYYSESGKSLRQSKPNEFIVDKDGRRTLGQISKEIERATGGKVKALPIYLKVGFHSNDTGMGYKHIAFKHLAQIKEQGFENALDFVKYTLTNFDKILKHPTIPDRIILRCSNESRGFMPVQLVDEGDYYSIITAYPKNNVNKNGELLYDGREPSAAATDGNIEATENESVIRTDNTGGVNPSAADVLTNSPSKNIAQRADDGNIKYSQAETNPVVVTGNEFGEYAGIEELRDKAIQYYKDYLQGTSVENKLLGKIDIDSQGLIEFTTSGRKKVQSSARENNKLLLVKHLPEMLRTAFNVRNIESTKEKHNRESFIYMDNAVELNGKVFPVHITLIKRNNGEIQFYNHNILDEKKHAGKPAKPESSNEALGTLPVGVSFEENITQSSDESNIKYSVNGGESLLEKIRRKMPDWVGKQSDLNERRRKFITRKLRELTGYKIAYGHLTGEDGVFVDDLQKVIRSRRAYDWENLLPKIGAVIGKQMKLPQSETQNNYIASWLLDGETDTSAEARAFAKAMRDNPAAFEILREIQSAFQEINEMSAMERTKMKIGGELPQKSLLQKILGGEIYSQIVDDLDPIKKMVAQVEKKFGKRLDTAANPYEQARLFKGSSGISLDNMISGEKVAEVRAALRKKYPRLNFDNFKPLAVILREAGGRADLKEFEAYCVACQTKDLYAANREAGEKIYDTMMSEADCDEIIEKYGGKYGRSQQDLVNFSRMTLEILCDSGVISRNARDKMITRWKNYVPMHRVFDENEELNFGDSMKHRAGSNRDLIHPIQTIIRNTHEMIKRAERNKVKRSLAGLARMGGFGEYVEEVGDKKPNDQTIITFYEGGAKKYLQTAPEVVEAVNNLQSATQGTLLTKILTAATGIIRGMYTAFSPDFAAGNIFRDIPDAYIHNRHGEINPLQMLIATWRGFMSALHKDETFYEWMALGGSQSTLVSPDRNYSQIAVDKLTKTRGERWFKSGVGGFFSQLLDTLQTVSEYSEYATRLGVYAQAKKVLGGNSLENTSKAALASRDSTIDFARAGKSLRTLNRYIAFSNAAVQGFDRTLRTFNPQKLKLFGGTDESERELFGAMVRLALTGILPALVCFALNHDKDWWRQLPEWQKENNWILSDGVKIPKGMDLGLRLASTMTEEFLNWAGGKSADLSRLLPRKTDIESKFVPTIFLPILEASMNYSLFMERPIVPAREQNLPDYMQYDSFSSGFAKYVGEKLGYSPRKIDHLISGYLGFLGKFALQSYDMTAGDKQFNLAMENLPMVRRFAFEPYRNPKIVQDYYEKLSEQEKFYNEYKATRKKPAGFDAVLYERIKKNRKALQALSKKERALNNNAGISPEERKAKLRELEKMRIKICERVIGSSR